MLKQTTRLIAMLTTALIVSACGVVLEFDTFAAPSGSTQAVELPEIDVALTLGPDGAFVLGSPDAPVTIVEFLDFRCPHCQTYASTIDQVIEELVIPGAARLELRVFPVIPDSSGTRTTVQSETYGYALHCAGLLGGASAYVAGHNNLMRAAEDRTDAETAANMMFASTGIDVSEGAACIADRFADENTVVTVNVALAQQATPPVSGTPAVRVRVEGQDGVLVAVNGIETGPPFSVLSDFVSQFTN